MTTDSPMRLISERAVSGTLGVSMSAPPGKTAGEKLILLQCLRLHSARDACEGAKCLRAADYLRVIGLSAPRPSEGPTDWQCTVVFMGSSNYLRSSHTTKQAPTVTVIRTIRSVLLSPVSRIAPA